MSVRGRLGYFRSGPVENDVAGCGHCQSQIIVPPGQSGVSKAVEMCRCCMRFVCSRCAGELVKGCVTWERRFEAAESRARMLAAIASD